MSPLSLRLTHLLFLFIVTDAMLFVRYNSWCVPRRSRKQTRTESPAAHAPYPSRRPPRHRRPPPPPSSGTASPTSRSVASTTALATRTAARSSRPTTRTRATLCSTATTAFGVLYSSRHLRLRRKSRRQACRAAALALAAPNSPALPSRPQVLITMMARSSTTTSGTSWCSAAVRTTLA